MLFALLFILLLHPSFLVSVLGFRGVVLVELGELSPGLEHIPVSVKLSHFLNWGVFISNPWRWQIESKPCVVLEAGVEKLVKIIVTLNLSSCWNGIVECQS